MEGEGEGLVNKAEEVMVIQDGQEGNKKRTRKKKTWKKKKGNVSCCRMP
jgi:hypothetical protein